MVEKIFFQSSLPRSGSTVFQNLMNQDPRFHASATSGLLELIYASRHAYTETVEFKAQDPEEMKKAFFGFCKGGMQGFYSAITDKQYVLDKSRGHMAYYQLLDNFYPNPKIICLVRYLPDIIASMEKLFRNNQHLHRIRLQHLQFWPYRVQARIAVHLIVLMRGLLNMAKVVIKWLYLQVVVHSLHFLLRVQA